MIRVFKTIAGAVLGVGLLSSAAVAHEYEELDTLDPDLRGFLITLLEDASADGQLDGSPKLLNSVGSSVSARLIAILDDADQEDMRWLQTVPY
ncbi:MAG: hypothetical protein AAFQ15_01850, partial [Pseudomonadota bacterium]